MEVKLSVELYQSFFYIPLCTLHGCKPAGVFARQGFGKGSIERNKEKLTNQRGKKAIPVHAIGGETPSRPFSLLQGLQPLHLHRQKRKGMGPVRGA